MCGYFLIGFFGQCLCGFSLSIVPVRIEYLGLWILARLWFTRLKLIYCSMVFCLRMFTYHMSNLYYPRYSQMVMYSSNSFNDRSRSEGLHTGFLGLNRLWCMLASEWNPIRDHLSELTLVALVGCCTLWGFRIERTRI